jgi:hypothetical protein
MTPDLRLQTSSLQKCARSGFELIAAAEHIEEI